MELSKTKRQMNDGASGPDIEPIPLPDNIRSIQPGGGTIQALELAWGRLRRGFLKKLRPGYVREMRARLQGNPASCPVEIIDSRDLKFFRNVTDCQFAPEDDPFKWRDRLPFARAGFAELLLFGGGSLILAFVVATGQSIASGWAVLPLALAAFVFYFFRDPFRQIPSDPGAVVSPADGKIVEFAEVEDPEFIGAPALRIGIFLSVFNVHINRSALAGRVIQLRYQPGKFINALFPESATENERLEIFLIEPAPPHRRFVIRQIAGAIARRIVCQLRPGETVEIGEKIGMIKFGSRTELLIPREGFSIEVEVGQTVYGGTTVLGRYTGRPVEG
jgi:phosphatidylserine decarboxylase